MGADGTTSQAWLSYSKVTSIASTAAALSSDDSITFDVDTGAENHYIPSEAHKLDNYSTSHTGHTVVCANNTEDPTRGCGSIQGKLSKVYTMDNFQP